MKIALKCDPIKIKIKENAINIKGNLDSPWLPDFPQIAYKEHLRNCIECPTRGLIARHQFIDATDDMVVTPRFKRNKKRILNSPQIQQLQAKLDAKINTLYPTTKKIRNYIIKNNRINYDTVTASKRFTFWDKIKMVLS